MRQRKHAAESSDSRIVAEGDPWHDGALPGPRAWASSVAFQTARFRHSGMRRTAQAMVRNCAPENPPRHQQSRRNGFRARAHARRGMTKTVETRLFVLAACHARDLKNITLPKQRAQGRPGVRCTRSLAWCKKTRELVTTGSPDRTGLPCAMVLTVSFVLAPETGFVVSVPGVKRELHRPVDISVGISGPHDFTVRFSGARLAPLASTASRAPRS